MVWLRETIYIIYGEIISVYMKLYVLFPLYKRRIHWPRENIQIVHYECYNHNLCNINNTTPRGIRNFYPEGPELLREGAKCLRAINYVHHWVLKFDYRLVILPFQLLATTKNRAKICCYIA